MERIDENFYDFLNDRHGLNVGDLIDQEENLEYSFSGACGIKVVPTFMRSILSSERVSIITSQSYAMDDW